MVTCAVLSEATPAGLASFAVVHPDNAALIAKLLGDPTLMRDMLVAGGAKAAKEAPERPHPAAQYGPAMQIYVRHTMTHHLTRHPATHHRTHHPATHHPATHHPDSSPTSPDPSACPTNLSPFAHTALRLSAPIAVGA